MSVNALAALLGFALPTVEAQKCCGALVVLYNVCWRPQPASRGHLPKYGDSDLRLSHEVHFKPLVTAWTTEFLADKVSSPEAPLRRARVEVCCFSYEEVTRIDPTWRRRIRKPNLNETFRMLAYVYAFSLMTVTTFSHLSYTMIQ